jgi:tRNA (cytidine/uridine-2'-O-)-methyltransferase
LVVLTTKSDLAYTALGFRPNDVLLCGRESSGVPEAIHGAADARVRVPMRRHLRSLNVAVSLAMVIGEALRQTGGFPDG